MPIDKRDSESRRLKSFGYSAVPESFDTDAIERAVLAEREECAKIAEQAIVGYGEHNAEADAALSSVAAAIRARGKA